MVLAPYPNLQLGFQDIVAISRSPMQQLVPFCGMQDGPRFGLVKIIMYLLMHLAWDHQKKTGLLVWDLIDFMDSSVVKPINGIRHWWKTITLSNNLTCQSKVTTAQKI